MQTKIQQQKVKDFLNPNVQVLKLYVEDLYTKPR